MKASWRLFLSIGIALAVIFATVVAAAGMLSSNAGGKAGTSAASAGTAPDNGKRGEHEKQEQHELDVRTHGDGNGKLRPDLFRKSVADFKKLKINASRPVVKGTSKETLGSASGGGVVGVQWTQIGPAPLVIDAEQNYQGAGPDAGQVVGIAIDPRNTSDNVVYAAFNDGGLWKTTDGGSTWKPLTDYMQSLSTGAVVLDPANPSIVYVGTGNIYNNGYFKGVGVYRSIDGGDTFSTVAGNTSLNGKGINLMVMPAANTLLVATNKGLYRSGNSGNTFTQISVGGTSGAFITDIDLDTQNSNTVYASVYGQGIFKSTDGGATFPAGASNNLWDATHTGAPTSGYGFVSFAQSTTDSGNTMYADAQSTAGCTIPNCPRNFAGMWKSTDGGATWSNITSTANAGGQLDGCQCGYDQTIGVDPVDANKVYIGFQELWYSSNGGASNFSNISANDIHWDHHALVFSPPNHRTGGDPTTRVWVGNDGGIAYSDDASSFTNRNGAMATNLFRAMDIGHGAGNNDYSYGGAQDTGTMRHRPSDSGTQWHESVDADGGPTAVSWQDPTKAFGISNGQFIRTTDGGNSWIRPGSNDIKCVPMSAGAAVDPNDGNHVYVPGAAKAADACGPALTRGLWRSVDGGASFPTEISVPSDITYIATTPTDSNLVWVGLANGQVAVSTDAQGATPSFAAKSVAGAPGGLAPAQIAIDPGNTDRVVVVYPGYTNISLPSRTKHVFLTTDAGSTWTDIGGTAGDPTQMVPDLPILSVVIDPQTTPHSIIVSSDLGVLRTQDNGATWQVLGLGLPNVDAPSLQIDSTVTPSLLRVGTYGRSAFELTSATGPLLGINGDLGFGFVDLGATATRQVELFNVGSADLHVNGFSRSGGSTEFSILSGPAAPVTITPGSHVDYTIAFSPTTTGNKTATFQINSDDPFQPVRTLDASGTGVSGQIALSGDLNFGVVPRGQSATKNVIVQNVGKGTLKLTNVTITGDALFSIVNGPLTFPVNIPAGEQVTYSVKFAPPVSSGPGTHTATFRVVSNDPSSPTDLGATADVGVPTFTLSSSSLAYGGVPVDDRTVPSTKTLSTTLSNQSSCPLCDLKVTGLAITGTNATDFTLVGPPSLPYTVAAGNSLSLSVEFNPSAGGARSGTLTISTDDPVNPTLTVALGGTGLKPAIAFSPTPTLIFGPTVFDPQCAALCGVTLPETFTNTGQAELIVDVVSFTDPAFSGPGVTNPLTRVQPGSTLVEQVTFHPTGRLRKVTGNLHIEDLFPLDPGNNVLANVPLCGESVGRGIRVLVVDKAGNPVANVGSLKLTATGVSAPPNVNLKNLPLQTISPPVSCETIRQQYENQALSTTDQSAPRGSYYTLTVSVQNKRATLTFGLKVNEFKLLVVTVG